MNATATSGETDSSTSAPAASGSQPPRQPTPSGPVVRRKGGRGWVYIVVAVIVLAGILAGAGYELKWFGQTTEAKCASGITLQGNGATLLTALAAQWTSVYDKATGNTVNYVSGGSGTGITDLTDKLVDFGATDEPLSPTQAKGLPGVLTLPITGGAVAIIYNVPGVPTGLNLTGAVIADIYLGTITTWNNSAIQALNPHVSLPDATITTVHRADAAGTTFVLTNMLSEDSTAWASGPGTGISISWPSAAKQEAVSKDSPLIAYVQSTPDTIGYGALTDVLTASPVASYAAVQNPSGNFIAPNVTNVASAIADKSAITTFPSASGNWSSISMVNAPGSKDYPMATFAYFFVFQNVSAGFEPSLTKAQVLVQWLSWAITSGQPYAGPLSYVALAPAIVSIDKAGISSMTFNGASIPACS